MTAVISRKAIGDLIKSARHQRGMSQRELAEALVEASGRDTVTRSEIARWERGRRIPTGPWRHWVGHVLRLQLPTIRRGS